MIEHQFLDAKFLLRQLEEVRCPQFAFAELIDVSPATLSLFLSGKRGASLATQQNMFTAIEFLESFREEHAGLPIDLSDVAALRPHFEAFLLARAEEMVIRGQAEMKARANGKSA